MKPRYIDFAGSNRPVYFGFNALFLLEKEAGIKLNDAIGDVSFDLAAQMLIIGLKEGARKEKQEFDLSIEEVRDGMDEYGIDRLDEIIEVLMEFFTKGDEKPGEALPVSL